ncbi:IS256 family transposase [Streptomyces sp. NPDC002285]
MTAPDSLPLHALAEDNLAAASPDLLRAMVKTFADALMSAEADALCNAGYGQVSDERVSHRNGYRPREWDTRADTVELSIPKLRSGSYFPHWLLERRRRAEQALISVVATAYLLGVSTRRVEKLAESLGVTQLSKSQVSAMARHLDEQVTAFRNRPLDAGPYAFVWVDALTQKVREGGRIINVHALIAVGVNADGHREILGLDVASSEDGAVVGVNADGHREILGLDVASSEDGAGWLAFLRSLIARGLSGVQLVVSDAHAGLVDAIGAVLPGASWQRCRTHYARNLLSQVPKSAQPWVATLLRTVFEQPDADAVKAQMRHVLDALEAKFPKAADHLDAAQHDLLAFTAFPREIWRQIWSNNPQERLNKEIRRRTDVVGIFPDRTALIRLVGAVLAEQNDEWTEARRYMGLDLLAKARIHPIESETDETAMPTELTA